MDKMAYQAQFLHKQAMTPIDDLTNALYKAWMEIPGFADEAAKALKTVAAERGAADWAAAKQHLLSTLPYSIGGAGAGLAAGIPVGLIGGAGAGYGLGKMRQPASDKAAPIQKTAAQLDPAARQLLEAFIAKIKEAPVGQLTNWMTKHPWLLGSGVAGATAVPVALGAGALGATGGYLAS